MKLGECQSKCEHIAGVPLIPAVAERLHQLYLAKGSLATTAIEGNTLSEDEALQLIRGDLKLPESRQYLGQELKNIVDACNDLLQTLKTSRKSPALDAERIRQLNRLVLDKLELPDGVEAGEIRSYEVSAGPYRGAPPEDCHYLLERLCNWLNEPAFNAPPDQRLAFATIKAILAHVYLAWIHPFGDGNGRVARLVEHQILMSSGFPAPAAHLLSNHYNQTRNDYYRHLGEARAKDGVVHFLEYAAQGLLDGLREQLDYIRRQQWQISWRDYVHGHFLEGKGEPNRRRRNLVLDLSEQVEPTPIHGISALTPRTASAYANRTSRTVSRDIAELISMGLVVREEGKVRACKEKILAFLPFKSQT
jgi:Fic family protein